MAAVPRIIYGMALDGALPRFLTWLHPRFKTPVIAIAIGVAIPPARLVSERRSGPHRAADPRRGLRLGRRLSAGYSVGGDAAHSPPGPAARLPLAVVPAAADYLQRRDHHRYRQYHAARDGQPPGAGAVRHNARPDRRLRPVLTVCVQRVNPFKPLVVEEVVERAINNYEKQTRGEMTPDVLRPWFETPLMNAVQRDLAGWPSEKLSERSALLRLNDATAVTFSVRQKRLFMASIHSCEFVVEGR